MRRSSIYYPLRYIVQCQQPGQAFFYSMAAFDLEAVACGYAKQCAAEHRSDYRYRVIDHHNNEDKCVYRSDTDRVAA